MSIVKRSSDCEEGSYYCTLTSHRLQARQIRYMIDDEADLGVYTDGYHHFLRLPATTRLEQKLTFTISGAAEELLVRHAYHVHRVSNWHVSRRSPSQAPTRTATFPASPAMVEVVVLGVASSYVSGIGSDNMLEIKDGSASFEIFTPVDAEEGDTALILVRVDGTEVARHAVIFGMAPTAPGMPMNVIAMATSHDMITVTWDAADDGGSAITGYVLQSKTGTMDFMTIAASSAEIWWNTLGLPDDER